MIIGKIFRELFGLKDKIMLFTHKDMDGLGCHILLEKVMQTSPAYKYVTNSNSNKAIRDFIKNDDDTFLIITDLNVDKETAEMLDQRGNVILIDHHLSAEFLKDYDWAFVKIGLSATLLVYHFLKENFNADIDAYKDFAYMVDDYDTWKHKMPVSNRFNILYLFIGEERFFNRFTNNSSIELTDTENLIVTIQEENIERYIKNKCENNLEMVDTKHGKCAVVFAEDHINLVAHFLLDNYDIDYAMIIAGGEKVSLRSKEDFDVSAIAQLYGGGGHKNAAGFQLNKEDKLSVLKKFIN